MASETRPNFILIMTDQQRGDCLSLERHPCLLTPNLDNIGGEGVHFRRAYTPCPSCVPARRALMTGTHPATNGMVGYRDHMEYDAPATMPGVLRDAGYQTALVGRNMHLWPRRKRFGFDEMVYSPDDYDTFLREQQPGRGAEAFDHGISANGWTARPWHLEESLHPTTWTVTEALRFLERRDPSCPFFLVVSFIAPHPPFIPPAFYLDRYLRADLPEPYLGDWATPPPNDGLGMKVDAPQVQLTGEALRSARAGYYGLINHVDDQIHRLFGVHSGLDRQTLNNTHVIFTSDHGEMLGDHYLFRKCYAYEGSARVPFLWRGPGIAPGQVCDQPVVLEDIMPTVLDFAGCDIPATVDGLSLAPGMRGETDRIDRDFIHGEHARCYGDWQANQFLTDGTWKYIWLTDSGREQLFNLDEDPGELHNLAAEPAQAERMERWRARLIERLEGRHEGFVANGKLVAGRPYPPTLPHVGGG